MTANEQFIAALEQARTTFADRNASAAECKASADRARRLVIDIDKENESAPQREAEILRALAPCGDRSIGQTIAALTALYNETEARALVRKVATHLAAELDARARERAEFEAERDKARKPFANLTRRAHEHARRAADGLRHAQRIGILFRTDVMLTKAGVAALSRCPRPNGTHVAYERTFHVPRIIATDDVMRATRLLGVWPMFGADFAFLDRPNCVFAEDEAITSALRELSEKADQRRIVLSEADVERAIAQAQAVLIAEFHKAVGALHEFVKRDAEISVSDRDARYPDGQLVFDPTMFPDGWHPSLMSRRIVLPLIDHLARAAE